MRRRPLGTRALQTQGECLVFVPKIPEPGTLALIGLGLAGIGFVARRRKDWGGGHRNFAAQSSVLQVSALKTRMYQQITGH
jgi:hypothetical protein